MKKIFLNSLIVIGLFSTPAIFANNDIKTEKVEQKGDASKGQKLYKKKLKKFTGLTGDKFAQLYTQQEWKDLFKENKVIEVLSEKFPDAKTFLESKKFKKYEKDIKAFCIEFAKDSGNVPSC